MAAHLPTSGHPAKRSGFFSFIEVRVPMQGG
jgi:hypothetical protein